MRISDWSSDVCSSDLIGEVIIGRRLIRAGGFDRAADATEEVNFPGGVRTQTKAAAVLGIAVEITSGVCRSRYAGQIVGARDRKSVVKGQSMFVRVDLGGRRIIKQQKHHTNTLSINTPNKQS